METTVCQIDKSIYLSSLEQFKNTYLVLLNIDLDMIGRPMITDEQEIIDLYLDHLSDYLKEKKHGWKR